MNRFLMLALAAAVTLAGCAGTSASDATADAATSSVGESPTLASGDAIEVVAGTLTWHSDETQGVAKPLTIAGQATFNECVSGGDGSIGQTNLDLRKANSHARVPDAPKMLSVLFSWEPTDYPKDRLVLAYQPAGSDTIIESDWITNGEETTIALEPGHRGGSTWGFWACVSKTGSTTATDPTEGPKLFAGDLTFRIDATA